MTDRFHPGIRRLPAMNYRGGACSHALDTLVREGSNGLPFAFERLVSRPAAAERPVGS
jgi:hypothetical protein